MAKCLNCRFLKEIRSKRPYGIVDSWLCKKLGIELENGYAMQSHSRGCGE